MLLVLGSLAEQLVGDLGIQLGLAGPDHLVDAGRRVRLRGVALAHLEGPLAHIGIGVRERLAVEPAAVGGEIDRHPVGHLGDGQVRHLHEQLVRVQ